MISRLVPGRQAAQGDKAFEGSLTSVLELYVVVIIGVGTERHVQPLEMRVARYWDTKGGMLTDSM